MIKPRPALFKWRHFEPEIIVCADFTGETAASGIAQYLSEAARSPANISM